MLKHFLVFSLAIPLCGYCQSYGDSSYTTASAIPSTARSEGWADGTTKANGVAIDLSISMPWSSPDRDELWGTEVHSWVDRKKPDHIFHYYLAYNLLNVVFGYDLRVEPVQGTDEIRCTFSALTDPDELPEIAWRHNKDVPVVALPPDMTALVVKSGGSIAITTLPLGPGRIAVVHYIRLTRTDLATAPQLK